MTSQQIAEHTVQVTLVAAGSHPALAARTLARHFGLPLEQAEGVLMKGRGLIAAQMRQTAVRAAQPLLAALGLQIAILPLGTKEEPERYDLSVRLAQGDALSSVMAELKRIGETTVEELAGPSGLVIRGVVNSRVEAIQKALRAVRGAHVTISAKSTARYDLFGPQDCDRKGLAPLRRHLSLMGCHTDLATSALAGDLDQSSLKHLLSRFPDCGLVGVDQAFQRYDVTLTGLGRLTRLEMQDFLATRGFVGRYTADALAAGKPLRIENGLGRASARQFLSDYATIGIPARADLIRI